MRAGILLVPFHAKYLGRDVAVIDCINPYRMKWAMARAHDEKLMREITKLRRIRLLEQPRSRATLN